MKANYVQYIVNIMIAGAVAINLLFLKLQKVLT